MINDTDHYRRRMYHNLISHIAKEGRGWKYTRSKYSDRTVYTWMFWTGATWCIQISFHKVSS